MSATEREVVNGKTLNTDLRPDAQAFDEIRIVTVPRYKTSGMSGDEWRISARIEFYRKGRKVHEETGLRNVETAAKFLAYEHARASDNGHAYFATEGDRCDQEGCAERATVQYRKLFDYCRSGHKTNPLELFPDRWTVRQFCDRHKQRGDCALDDADVNYELLRTL